jgi:hypothetical protein
VAHHPSIELGQVTNFSGGPNFRDSPTEIAAVEAYGAYNCSFDERGGVQSRLGFQKRNGTPFGTGYKAQLLASTPSLYWRFDEGAGAITALDASGNGNTGTYGTGVTLAQPGLLTGDSNTAAAFNDTANAFVRAASYSPFASGSSRTFMGWANRAATTDDDTLFGAITTGLLPAQLVVLAGGTDVRWQARGGSTVTWPAAWPGTGQRVHWALTYNDTTRVAELFINGVSKGQLTVGTAYPASGVFMAGLGPGNVSPWNGVLDEIAVFGSILSGATITAIYNAGLGGGDFIVNDYYSQLLGVTLTQCGRSLYRAASTVSVHTFSSAACVTFTEINGVVIACHPVDGLWSSPDGSVWTKITAANAPTTGTLCVETWQARLFVGLSDGTLHWSDEGTIATWTATNFVAVWEEDQAPIVALHIGSGQDIRGNPGLLAFKQDSVYRINDPLTGAYTILSTSEGAGGPKAVVGVGGRVCWIGKHGIFWWREDQPAPVNASDLLRPAWRIEQLSFANQAGWAAGRRLNRAYFSCSSAGSTVNDLAFELNPDEGWLAPRSDAMTCYSTSKGLAEQTYGGSPTAPGQMYLLDVGGTDDGQKITGWFQSRWLVPNGGFQAQVWQARIHGRGAGTVTFLIDYEDSGGSSFPFDFSLDAGGFRYDNGVHYDSGVRYGIVTLAETEAIAGLGACRQFSLRFDFSSDSTAVGRTLFGNVPAPTVGAFALYGIDILHVPLGLS